MRDFYCPYCDSLRASARSLSQHQIACERNALRKQVERLRKMVLDLKAALVMKQADDASGAVVTTENDQEIVL